MSDSRRVSTVLGLLFGLAGMGSAAGAIAVPVVAEDFGISNGTATWTISLYVLMLAVTTAVYGRVSDLVGTRLPLLFGVGLMAVGALLAAAAPTFTVLLLARMLQGAGAAAVPTLGVTIVNGRYSGDVRSVALGRVTAVAAALMSIGPLVGGLLEHALGWRAVMAMPVLGLLLVPPLWHALTRHRDGVGLDVLGAALVALSAGGVVLMVQSPSTGVSVLAIGAFLTLLGVPATAAWVRRRPDGFLPISVVRNGVLVRSAVSAASVPAAWFALLVAAPAVLVAEGWEPWQVGMLLLPSGVVALFVPRLVGPVIGRIGPYRAMAVSALGATCSSVAMAVGAWYVVPALIAVAASFLTVAFGVGQPSLVAAVADSTEPKVQGVALGIATLVFLAGGSVGSAVVGGLGSLWGVEHALLVVAVLPLLGVLALLPDLGRARTADAEVLVGADAD